MQFACLRATLAEVMTDKAYAHMEKLAKRLGGALAAAIKARGAPWHVVRVGARVEVVCAPGPLRNGGEAALAQACERVFGSGTEGRARIIATLPSEAADDPGLVKALVDSGMDCARINCAHDDAGTWARMIANVHAATQASGRPCRLLMDIAGPKLRVEDVRAPDKYRLHPGERPKLTSRLGQGSGKAVFTLNYPQVVEQLRVGAEVCLDDGKARGRIIAVDETGAEIEIIAARTKGLRLKPGKGVNFPALDLDLSPLTPKDLADLDLVARAADLVGFSFVQRVEDVARLEAELAARRGDRPLQTLVLKIETPLAVRNLPRLIVRAAARHPVAVMIARGDLAVEVGFARLSEMLEEILWLCEAAHVPVIWATEVLDRMVHEGVASRPETTDAAMAQRADAVMLNKGPYLPQGVRFLREVLDRMERHQAKKFPRLARLRAWTD
jgi:pyruvate kinase